ncbi:VOC family protein [Burkholderia cepacia]|uniref:VOC family protein n=1 Tax=Burkholderia cepacia TaxID=292 RepID=UPI001FC87E91|nr:hypothetical protein [Burkholderia cepacia]
MGVHPAGFLEGWVFGDFQSPRLSPDEPSIQPIEASQLVILYADDLAEIQRRIEATGATINRQAFSFPGGRRFHFIDPDGYELAVWSADESCQ